jgi:hypothetical protein
VKDECVVHIEFSIKVSRDLAEAAMRGERPARENLLKLAGLFGAGEIKEIVDLPVS